MKDLTVLALKPGDVLVVRTDDVEKWPVELVSLLKDHLTEHFGFKVPVLVLQSSDEVFVLRSQL